MNKWNGKTAIVAGGAGFLGAHLCRKLLLLNYRVICLDNLQTSRSDKIDEMLGEPMFTFINHDIRNPIDAGIIMHFKCPNGRLQPLQTSFCIYNLACPASPVWYQKDEVNTLEISFLGASNLLKLAKKLDARILQASTSEVYGDPLENPQKEEYWGNVNCNGIRSCYDEGKRVAESLFFGYHRQKGVDIRVVRIFNTYGPGMQSNDGRVISNFVTQALGNKDITIYGDGSQTRSFCYVDDLIDGIIKMMDQTKTVGPINLGNPVEHTIKEVSEKIRDLVGSKSKIVYEDLPGDDPKVRKPDISRAIETLGWTPKIQLEEGLKKTIEYFNVIPLSSIKTYPGKDPTILRLEI